jgi:YHS domain-containing protein
MGQDQTMCPVMKNPVDADQAMVAGLTGEYQGKVFYFCCPPCKTKFVENSEKYLANLPPIPGLY